MAFERIPGHGLLCGNADLSMPGWFSTLGSGSVTGKCIEKKLIRKNHAKVIYDTAGLEIKDETKECFDRR